MSLPFNLNSVLATASLVEGFDVVRNAFPVEGRFTKRVITYADAVYEALNDVAEDYSDWPEDQGFGSSDMTYVRKSLIINEKFFYNFTLKLGILAYFIYLYYVLKNIRYEFTI